VVTARRLAERIEYSQPVLYSHFNGTEAIVRAVAIEGFGELAGELRSARDGAGDTRATLGPLADAYLGFAASRPAHYDAMFVMSTDLPFGQGNTPEPLRAAFDEIYQVIAELGRDDAQHEPRDHNGLPDNDGSGDTDNPRGTSGAAEIGETFGGGTECSGTSRAEAGGGIESSGAEDGRRVKDGCGIEERGHGARMTAAGRMLAAPGAAARREVAAVVAMLDVTAAPGKAALEIAAWRWRRHRERRRTRPRHQERRRRK
jgi:AcrR family transcriptional regulator